MSMIARRRARLTARDFPLLGMYFYVFRLNLISTNLCQRLEKYRPTEFKDIIGNKEAIDRFDIFSNKGNIPNVILSGPPGVGKTTVSLTLTKFLPLL